MTALHATADHRRLTLEPISGVVGDLRDARAGAYTAYSRRLGPDAVRLPASLTAMLDDVLAFADPTLGDTLTP